MLGALIVFLGVVLAGSQFAAALAARRAADFHGDPAGAGRATWALALEFQLGADILSTAVAPTWNEIGKLGAIAIIRTALNYFLSKEMKEEQSTRAAEKRVAEHAGLPG